MSRRVWSKREDEELTALVQKFGDRRGKDGNWAEISKRLPGRTNKVPLRKQSDEKNRMAELCEKDCRKRWFHSLDPTLRKGRWTKEEDEILLAAHQRLGPAWKEIGEQFPCASSDIDGRQLLLVSQEGPL
ncbi:hypothetical protein N7452_001885 [Penicillium brevicompactum]|uniref:Uncharacterized protein n=1 Tax=Penicillium brevicompactum TaxID=5074 RepID=A0A9W9R3G4_PENBR|nr:hypothetical protein N7452_001885 [Penicillium brevicompactum]